MRGLFDQDILVPKDAPKIMVEFEGFSFDMFLEIDNQNITRIYARSPAIAQTSLENKWRNARRIGLLFKFAALITGKPGIWAGFQNTAITATEIVRLYADDKVAKAEGRSVTTLDTLCPSIRFWLDAKGFKNTEDIVRLQESASSLSEALLMLMTLLPYRPAHVVGTSKRKTVAKSLTRSGDVFARDKLEQVKSLLVELNPHWFPGNVYSKIQRSLPDEGKEASANDMDSFEQLDKLQNTLIQYPSDNAKQERDIEPAKKDKVERLLEREMHLAEDPDIILEMNEEQLTVTESTSLQALFQNISQSPLIP